MIVDPAVKHIWGDLRRLKQVLVNLLSNAVKFTPPGGSVGLSVGGNQENNQVRFTVWDTGIGIPLDSIPNLFKPFTQLDNSLSRKYEGTGLGLALAYHIVEMHSGGIQISSEEGKGSQFTVTLNWNDDSVNMTSPSISPYDMSASAEMETYSSISQKIQRFFSEFGIEFISYIHEEQNFEKIAEIFPNMIVLNLPLNSECRALANRLREDARTRGIPIMISVSSLGTRDDRDLPEGVIPFNLLSSRQEFRKVLKSVSVSGTASLIRKVVLINPRNSFSDQIQSTILLVDDNEVTVRPLSDYLVSRGYRVVLAYSGTEAVVQAREQKPDMILMDIQMPGMDGIEAIRRIRADTSIQKIPVIALTALAMPSDRQRCLDAGANGYMSKPISLRYLIEVIESEIQQIRTII